MKLIKIINCAFSQTEQVEEPIEEEEGEEAATDEEKTEDEGDYWLSWQIKLILLVKLCSVIFSCHCVFNVAG